MMRFWHASYPDLKPAHIDAPLCTERPQAGDKRGPFFSGGVDSTFSLLRHDSSAVGCGSGIVDDLIFVAGLDIPISDRAEVEMRRSIWAVSPRSTASIFFGSRPI